VSVSAADNMAAGLSAGTHRSRAGIDFTVVNEPRLRITHAYLFPNPVASGRGGGGTFVVDAPGDSVNVLLRIYTASGRLIRTLRQFGGLGQAQLPWDGLDDEGQALANGVYFFRVHVNPREADGESSPRQKADADGRIVILNRR
jgi:flagellar hook assembly protein FlgD